MTLHRTPEQRQLAADYRAMTREENKAKKRERPAKVIPTDAGQRQPRVREPDYLAYLRRQPCAIMASGRATTCDGPIQACHIRTGKPGERPTGLQRKPDDRRATPMCATHHALQHGTNEMRFLAAYGLDPFAVAEAHYERFLGAPA